MKEPAVIGYPRQKGVAIERVAYPARNMGTKVVANLFKPAGFDSNRKYAAVVVTHPFGGVKERTAGLYALRLAEQGFLTLAYDASYQGESGGEPRLMEVPAQRLDDISCAIDFLVRHPQVDAERIGSLGICAGGGYALCHAATELRVKAVAAVSTLTSARRAARAWARSPTRTHEAPEGRRRGAVARGPRRARASGAGGAGQRFRLHGEHAAALPGGLRLLPHGPGTASQLAEPLSLLEPAAADGLLPLRAARHDLAPAPPRHCRLQGGHPLLEPGGVARRRGSPRTCTSSTARRTSTCTTARSS